jgi:hypothetical protein
VDLLAASRRPADERNAQRSLENALNHFEMATALGVDPGNTVEQNVASLRRMWSAGQKTPRTGRRRCARCAPSRWSSAS